MNFWEEKSLTEMSREEWESLCDHCGKCCLLKLRDDDEEDEAHSIYYTDIACKLFDEINGQCTDYVNRVKLVSSCVRLTQDNLEAIEWLPTSCTYRRVMEGRGLPDWHHLVSGDKNSIHQTGNSVLGKVVSERNVNSEDDEDYPYEEHIVQWPLDSE